VKLGAITIELNLDEKLAPSALRAFAGATSLDSLVDSLDVPQTPSSLAIAIRTIRWYRARIAPRLGQRCVFDPSCSRYAELVLRQHGVVRGTVLTVRRLFRCRPGAGGVDLPTGGIL
jgi:putative membrane protein insertion efficiency factor